MAVLGLCLRALGVTLLFAITLFPIADHHVGARAPDSVWLASTQAELGSIKTLAGSTMNNYNRHHHPHNHPSTRQPIELARPLPNVATTNVWLRVTAMESVTAPVSSRGGETLTDANESMARGILQPLMPPTVSPGGLALNAATPPKALLPTILSWRIATVDSAIPPSFIPTPEAPPPLQAA